MEVFLRAFRSSPATPGDEDLADRLGHAGLEVAEYVARQLRVGACAQPSPGGVATLDGPPGPEERSVLAAGRTLSGAATSLDEGLAQTVRWWEETAVSHRG